MGRQIVDATIVEARRPRLNETEKVIVKGGGVPEDWKPARTRQTDRDGRWTLKRGRKRPAPAEGGKTRIATSEILVPAFGYKNYVSIDRQHGLFQHFTVTHAAAHDGGQLGALLDPGNTASQVWADTAYRSKANLALLERRGLAAEMQRPKPSGRPMPAHIRRANAVRATVRSAGSSRAPTRRKLASRGAEKVRCQTRFLQQEGLSSNLLHFLGAKYRRSSAAIDPRRATR